MSSIESYDAESERGFTYGFLPTCHTYEIVENGADSAEEERTAGQDEDYSGHESFRVTGRIIGRTVACD
jgi:hypothetical protein